VTLLAVAVPVAYFAGWVTAARCLFARWRPGRDPVRCVRKCQAGSNGGFHDIQCYRQRRKDLTRVAIDADSAAVQYAMLAALAWPVILLAWAVTARPPELDGERRAREKREKEEAEERKARLQAEIGALESELDRARGGA